MSLEAAIQNLADAINRLAGANAGQTDKPAPSDKPAKPAKPKTPPVQPEPADPGLGADEPETPVEEEVPLKDVQAKATKIVQAIGLEKTQQMLKDFKSPDGKASTMPAANRGAFIRQADTVLAKQSVE